MALCIRGRAHKLESLRESIGFESTNRPITRPERCSQLGFGFVPTSLHVVNVLNEWGKTYHAEVLKCVERINA